MIHATAIIHPQAKLDSTVEVGPYAVIDEGVEVGAHCKIGPHVYLTGRARIGQSNQFHAGCVIGDAPQDLRYGGQLTGVVIGDNNVFREHATVHRSNDINQLTHLGSGNFLMVNSHVGHNGQLGDHVILANGVLLAGHVTIEDRAFISGNCLIHQFVRIGTLAMMQGGAAISKDLPPFMMARGDNGICGLNTVGLRRAGMPADDRLELRKLYHALFRGTGSWKARVEAARREFSSAPARRVIEFVSASQRGICADVSSEQDLAGSYLEEA